MKKVKEWLDTNFIAAEDNEIKLKENGHYCVMGQWSYPAEDKVRYKKYPNGGVGYVENQKGETVHTMSQDAYIPTNQFRCNCNNETLYFMHMHDDIYDGSPKIGRYGYAQTYKHLEGTPLHWTDEMVIDYLKRYKRIIDLKNGDYIPEIQDVSLDKFRDHSGARVKDLLDFIEEYNIPEDALILSERILDSYFEGSNIEGFGGYIDPHTGERGVYPEGSRATGWDVVLKDCDDSDGYKQYMKQFHPIWWPVKYKDDDNVYLHIHY